MAHTKAVAKVREILEHKDYRLTPQREAVLRILLENESQHMTAEDIYGITRVKHPEIGLATIYRSLELFQSLGIIARLDFGEGGRKYEICSDDEKHYHHHLLCMDCGKIIEFNEDLLEELETRISRESGFKIIDHSLRFFGRCKECSSNNEKR